MIVSSRGVEFGFAASTHPSDFSNADIKARLRAAAPNIYSLLPASQSGDALTLERALGTNWNFRRKSRLEPGRSDFPDVNAWLAHFRSSSGAKEGGGCIAQYLDGQSLDDADLRSIVQGMAETFQPLMERISASQTSSGQDEPKILGEQSFANLFAELVRQLAEARKTTFQETPALWGVIAAIQNRLTHLPSLQKRPYIITKWSLGKGNWADVPWIALLNRNVTTSVQSGLYVAFLVTEDLSAIYLTLIQGTTALLSELGRASAIRTLRERADAHRAQLADFADMGIIVGDDVDLKTEGWRSTNYEAGTVADSRFSRDELPSDDRIEALLETFLAAYRSLSGR